MSEFWLDLGAGKDAEHWAATPGLAGVLRVALDPLITPEMVESGRVSPLPADILRVGAEIRPSNSVEAGKGYSGLPFRDAAFTYVHCGFVLHLYLEILELLVAEVHRVLLPGGRFEVLMPHFGHADSERNLAATERELRRVFGNVERDRFPGPFSTFWADLYRDRTFRFRCEKPRA
jgi:SAM-dependent methyltransferase